MRTTLRKSFTVICRWRASEEFDEEWHLIGVKIQDLGDAQDAANNAALFLIWDRQGMAEPMLVVSPTGLFVPDRGVFDSNEYSDVITFGGLIEASQELVPRSTEVSVSLAKRLELAVAIECNPLPRTRARGDGLEVAVHKALEGSPRSRLFRPSTRNWSRID